jgi:hypothetical protein
VPCGTRSNVFDGLAGLATRRVREHVRTIRHALGIERLQSREHSRVQGDRMWPAALGPRNPNDAVQKVHVVPPHVKETASAQARVHGEDDLFGQKWRRLDRLRRLDESVVLILRKITQPRVVFVEEL